MKLAQLAGKCAVIRARMIEHRFEGTPAVTITHEQERELKLDKGVGVLTLDTMFRHRTPRVLGVINGVVVLVED